MDNISDKEVQSERKSHSENGFNMVDSQDLEKADLDAMKGDTIGDTVYSGKWIINTLISLSKVYEDEWSESLESDLCTLWDMTAEKDIVIFLNENDFLQMAEFTLKISKEPRLTEIILGIIGNMCCQPEVLEAVGNAENLITLIFALLSSDDSETLIQVLRLLQCAVWDIEKNPHTKWLRRLKECEFFGDAISFILQSSTNDNLLIAAVNLLQSIAIVKMPDESCLLIDLVKVDQLVPALVESFSQLIPRQDGTHSRADLKFIENWLMIFLTVVQSKVEIFASEKNDENLTKIIEVFLQILQPYRDSSNLLPLEERVALCIHDSVEMISWFQRNKMCGNPKIVSVVVTIMHELRLAMKMDLGMDRIMDTEGTKDLVKYLEKYWLETAQANEENELLKIIEMCQNDVIKCLMEVAEEYSKEYPDAIAKLLRVESLFINL